MGRIAQEFQVLLGVLSSVAVILGSLGQYRQYRWARADRIADGRQRPGDGPSWGAWLLALGVIGILLLGSNNFLVSADGGTAGQSGPAPIHPNAVNLTQGMGSFEPDEGHIPITAEEDVWLPIPDEADGWRVKDAGGELAYSRFVPGESDGNADDVFAGEFHCYAPSDRGIEYPEFTDYSSAADAVEEGLRTLRPELAVFDRVGEPEFHHFEIDGRAVLHVAIEFHWTQGVDSETGEPFSTDHAEYWGLVAYRRDDERVALCSVASNSLDSFEAVRDLLLSARLTT